MKASSSSKGMMKAPRMHRPGGMKMSLKSFGAVKGLPGQSRVVHNGQPASNGGGGLKTGHTATNTGGSASDGGYKASSY